jgi:hypothetical protein
MKSDGADYSAIIESLNVPFDLYVRKGLSSIPDQTNFDAVVKQTNYVVL